MTKPKLLLISALSPWPTTSGGATRVWQTLKYLSQSYELHFVTFIDSNQDLEKLSEKIKPYCKTIITLPKQPKKSFSRFFTHGVPYWFSEWHHPELALIVRQVIKKHQIELVQIETSQLLYLVSGLPSSVFTICTAYDVQLVSFWRRLTETKNWLTKLGKLFLLAQVYWYEAQFLPKFNLLTAVSEVDKNWFERIFGVKKIIVAPNGYEPVKIRAKQPSERLRIGFIGSTAHSPNQQALEYLIQKIIPALEIKATLVVAGEIEPRFLPASAAITIKNLGFVTDLAEFYGQIDVLVAPLFSGSGTRLKILESLAYKTPIVTTRIGAEGLAKSPLIKLAESPSEFAVAIAQFKTQDFGLAEIKPDISLTWQAIFATYVDELQKKHK